MDGSPTNDSPIINMNDILHNHDNNENNEMTTPNTNKQHLIKSREKNQKDLYMYNKNGNQGDQNKIENEIDDPVNHLNLILNPIPTPETNNNNNNNANGTNENNGDNNNSPGINNNNNESGNNINVRFDDDLQGSPGPTSHQYHFERPRIVNESLSGMTDVTFARIIGGNATPNTQATPRQSKSGMTLTGITEDNIIRGVSNGNNKNNPNNPNNNNNNNNGNNNGNNNEHIVPSNTNRNTINRHKPGLARLSLNQRSIGNNQGSVSVSTSLSGVTEIEKKYFTIIEPTTPVNNAINEMGDINDMNLDQANALMQNNNSGGSHNQNRSQHQHQNQKQHENAIQNHSNSHNNGTMNMNPNIHSNTMPISEEESVDNIHHYHSSNSKNTVNLQIDKTNENTQTTNSSNMEMGIGYVSGATMSSDHHNLNGYNNHSNSTNNRNNNSNNNNNSNIKQSSNSNSRPNQGNVHAAFV